MLPGISTGEADEGGARRWAAKIPAMDDDKVIRFPGAATGPKKPRKPGPPPSAEATPTDDQRKSVEIALSGMSFITIGIRPTADGADFFTAVQGEPRHLLDAEPHLPGVIARALSRKGWR